MFCSVSQLSENTLGGAGEGRQVRGASSRRASRCPLLSTPRWVPAAATPSALLLGLLASQLINLRRPIHVGDGGGELKLFPAVHSQVT